MIKIIVPDGALGVIDRFQDKVDVLFMEARLLPSAVHELVILNIQHKLNTWRAELRRSAVEGGPCLAKGETVKIPTVDTYTTRAGPSCTEDEVHHREIIPSKSGDEESEGVQSEQKHSDQAELRETIEVETDCDLAASPDMETNEKTTKEYSDRKRHKKKWLHQEKVSCETFKCHVCQKELKTSKGLADHVESHSSYPVPCPDCGKLLKSKSNEYIHKKLHQGKLLQCPECDYTAGQQAWLNNHIDAVHRKKQKFLCNFCAKSFCYESVLKKHMKALHSAGPLLLCHQCEYTTRVKESLKRHIMAKHTSDREVWICDLCGNVFFNRGSFRDHRRIHTGEKAYPCPKCDMVFANRSSKNRHLKSLHGNESHVCRTCEKKFKNKVSLSRHEVIHTGEKNFACGFCHHRCNTRSNLRKHWRVVHKKADHDYRHRPVKKLYEDENQTVAETTSKEETVKKDNNFIEEVVERTHIDDGNSTSQTNRQIEHGVEFVHCEIMPSSISDTKLPGFAVDANEFYKGVALTPVVQRGVVNTMKSRFEDNPSLAGSVHHQKGVLPQLVPTPTSSTKLTHVVEYQECEPHQVDATKQTTPVSEEVIITMQYPLDGVMMDSQVIVDGTQYQGQVVQYNTVQDWSAM